MIGHKYMLLTSIVAAGAVGFAGRSTSADSFSLSFGINAAPAYISAPAYTPAPTCVATTYVAQPSYIVAPPPVYCPPPVVYALPVYRPSLIVFPQPWNTAPLRVFYPNGRVWEHDRNHDHGHDYDRH